MIHKEGAEYPYCLCNECFQVWLKKPDLKNKVKQAAKDKIKTSIEEVKECLKKPTTQES